MNPADEHNEAVFAKIRKYWGENAEIAARGYAAGELSWEETEELAFKRESES